MSYPPLILRKVFNFLVISSLLFFVSCKEQTVQKNALQELTFAWEIIENFHKEELQNLCAFTITNNTDQALAKKNWTLYFNYERTIKFENVSSDLVEIKRVNGDFYALSPKENFSIGANESIRVEYISDVWVINYSDAPAGLYIVPQDENGKELQAFNVKNFQVKPITKPEQTTRIKGDVVAVPTAKSRFEANSKIPAIDASKLCPITPSPYSYKKGTGSLSLNDIQTISYNKAFKNEAKLLKNRIKELTGKSISTVLLDKANSNTIALVKKDIRINNNTTESYELNIDKNGIVIAANDNAGIFYGTQSLAALLPLEGDAINYASIQDAPRFGFRGMFLDVGRNFQTKETVLKLIDAMAYYKLNKFHFHVCDDEGWRLDIEGLPELTEVGSKRGHTLTEDDMLMPRYGSGHDVNAKDNHGTGHYTRQDFIEILQYAKARQVEVIPEIDMPGHARAAIVSMNARHKKLLAAGQEAAAKEFWLSDPNDDSEYFTAQMFNDNVINVCQESTYNFLDKVVAEVVAMYKEADAKLTIIHTGGDEVPKGVWEKSLQCRELFATTKGAPNKVYELHDYFIERFNSIISKHGLITAGWEEVGLTITHEGDKEMKVPNPKFVNKNVLVNHWNTIVGWGGEENGYKLANSGYPVVLSNASNLYFDLAYNKDPDEMGYYWASHVDAKSVFNFFPLDIYKTIEKDRMGNVIKSDFYKDAVRLTKKGRENILGIQGQLWSENSKGPTVMEYQIFPKLISLAERAWAKQPEWFNNIETPAGKKAFEEDWTRFSNQVGHYEMARLDKMNGGYNYRIPLAGAVVRGADKKLVANVAYPGLTIRYTTDGSEPDINSPIYMKALEVKDEIKLKTFTTSGRASRTSTVQFRK